MSVNPSIRIYRESRGWSGAEVSRRMAERGIKWHQTTLWKVENGERSLGLQEGLVLADVLGVRPEQLVTEDSSWAATLRLEALRSRRADIVAQLAEVDAELKSLEEGGS